MKRIPTLLVFSLLSLLLLTACARPQPSQEASLPTDAPTDTPVPLAESEVRIETAVSAAPTEEPHYTPAPTQTPEPTPTPEPTFEPVPAFTFEASLSMPLPEKYPLHKGMKCTIDGVVKTEKPLVRLWAQTLSSKGKVLDGYEMTFDPTENITEYRLLDETFSNDISCFAEGLSFQKLPVGTHTFILSAEDADGRTQVLSETQFTVEDTGWYQLIPNQLRCNYEQALAFFGSEERFLFKFKFREGRSITLNSEWSKAYVSTCQGLNGSQWTVHADAVPYFEQACRYLETTYIRLHTGKTDSGPVLLGDLVEMDGTMVRRFTNDGAFVSHHSLGTAVDINAHTTSNKNKYSNRERIYTEVSQYLTYNGITETDGVQCYDFTYTGTKGDRKKGIPEVLVNYFLYELAFYRAGFSWGVYYPHTSDAMHFTLTELSPALFESGPQAMRKVYTYIEE